MAESRRRAVACMRRRPRESVRLRSLAAGDTATVLEVFSGMGPRSRELRFLAPKLRLTTADLRQLTDVDAHDHVAVVAEAADGRPIGLARFVRDPDETASADVAVTVVDAWQGRGVGTRLASALLDRAVRVGVRRFTLVVRPDNEAAIRLLHRIPGDAELLALDRDVAEFAITLGGPIGGSQRWRATVKGLPR